MTELTVKIHCIETDGLPSMNDDDLTGRVCFIHDGNVYSGWPLADLEDMQDRSESEGVTIVGNSLVGWDGRVLWEASEDHVRGKFAGVTHWIELPQPFWGTPWNSNLRPLPEWLAARIEPPRTEEKRPE